MYAVTGLAEQGSTRRRAVYGRWHRNLDLTIGNSAETTVTWDAESEDPYGFMAIPGSTPTVPVGLGGLYVIHASLTYQGQSGGQRNVYIYVNGAQQMYSTINNVSADFVTTQTTAIIPIRAGGTVYVSTWQNSGVNANLRGNSNSGVAGSQFQLVRVGDI